MMTPAQLKSYEFKTAGRNAYKADDVDSFFAEVVINYEKMFRENSELIKRVSLLANKIEEYQTDENNIKQAVLSAQKAADLIIKEAENSVSDSKSEAEAILAAAKGEADIIKSDAEKQAIADSELVLALATDKAEDIIAKAKEKAHGILIAANDSASDTMGQATRTITSESLHYDMLKKEVAEFRASILAQYKAHIEMISKLPELAVEEAQKIENIELPEPNVEELDAVEEVETLAQDGTTESDDIFEFVSDEAVEEVSDSVIEIDGDDDFDDQSEVTGEELETEPVIKTTLPYDFFEEDTKLEFVKDDVSEEEPICELDAFENSVGMEFDDIDSDAQNQEEATESNNFSIDLSDIDLSLFEEDEESSENDSVAEIPTHIVVDNEEDDEDDDVSDFFDAIETIDPFDEEEEEKKPRGFFRRRK